MTAIILSIGDELVLGQTVDTNSAWLSRELAAVGCAVKSHLTVGDDQAGIEEAIRVNAVQCDVLIITGGIGPTADDLTRQALAAVMKVPLELNQEWLTELESFFAKRGRPMPALNRIQAMIPQGAKMLFNTNGTAAGIHANLKSQIPNLKSQISNSRCDVFVTPGVPKEMTAMFQRDILPFIRERSAGAVILSRTLHTFGTGESSVAEMLGALMDRTRNPSVGTTVSGGIVSLRINARAANVEQARRELEETDRDCRSALGDLIFGADDDTLPAVVGKMLKSAGKTVATAESCTGGLLSKLLTDISGSSAYFTHGFITYANAAKTQLLNVPAELIERYGAVSEPVAEAMAKGAREKSKADFAMAISGVAGPDGGTAAKPVGTVCISLAHAAGSTTRTFNLAGDREMVRLRSAYSALSMLRYHLLGKPMP